MAANVNDYFSEVKTSGTTRPVATTLSAQKLVSATTASLQSTSGWDTGTVVHGILYRTDANGDKVAGSQIDWKGIVSGTTITDFTVTAGTDDTYAIGSVIILAPTAEWADQMAKGIQVEHNQDGTHDEALITSRTEDTSPDPDADFVLTYDTSATALKKAKLSNLTGATDGWIQNVLPSVSSVTANGNRSYDITFASTVASTLSSGMRLRTTRTVAAPTYMGGLMNGSSHYFTKTTPTSTLSTVTNNFTLHATIQPTSYVAGSICGRGDAGATNGFFIDLTASGQARIVAYNAGGANYRAVTTYQSVSLNKKTTITATWQGGTAYKIYFDGVEVPSAVTTSGTAPTTSGTGGDFSIGRWGAYAGAYFTGYISGVGVFDAVLSASTIKAMQGQALTGSETNCIGAWSLNNTAVNQQAPGTNDLTATGGVGYSNKSPYGNDGVSSTLDYALVMSVSGSTVTCQTAEGCTIPTSGGVTSVAYSVQGNPYGWVSDKGRWSLQAVSRTSQSTGTPAATTAYNAQGFTLSYPVGSWIPSVDNIDLYVQRAAAGIVEIYALVATSASTITPVAPELAVEFYQDMANVTATLSIHTRNIKTPNAITVTSPTTYYVNYYTGIASLTNIGLRQDRVAGTHSILPAGL
jgi:hypothetical protein